MEAEFTLNSSAIVCILVLSEENFSEVCKINSLIFKLHFFLITEQLEMHVF